MGGQGRAVGILGLLGPAPTPQPSPPHPTSLRHCPAPPASSAGPTHWPLPGTAPPALAPVRTQETLFMVPLKKPDSALGPWAGAPPQQGLAGPRKPGEQGAGTLPSLGTLWARGPPSCPCKVGGRAHAGSIQGAGPVHASPSAQFPDSPGSGPKPEAGLPSSQLPGGRCQAPGRGCTPRWAGPRGRASSMPPATAVSPLFLHHAPRSGPPSPASPPQPPPQVRAPTCSLLLRAADPTRSCAEAPASLGWPWSGPEGQGTLARFEQGPGPQRQPVNPRRQPSVQGGGTSRPLAPGEAPAWHPR